MSGEGCVGAMNVNLKGQYRHNQQGMESER